MAPSRRGLGESAQLRGPSHVCDRERENQQNKSAAVPTSEPRSPPLPITLGLGAQGHGQGGASPAVRGLACSAPRVLYLTSRSRFPGRGSLTRRDKEAGSVASCGHYAMTATWPMAMFRRSLISEITNMKRRIRIHKLPSAGPFSWGPLPWPFLHAVLSLAIWPQTSLGVEPDPGRPRKTSRARVCLSLPCWGRGSHPWLAPSVTLALGTVLPSPPSLTPRGSLGREVRGHRSVQTRCLLRGG